MRRLVSRDEIDWRRLSSGRLLRTSLGALGLQKDWREQEKEETTQITLITDGTQTPLVSGYTEREHGEQDLWHPGAAETCGWSRTRLYYWEGRVRTQSQREELEATIEVTVLM